MLSEQSVLQFGVAGGPMLRRPAEYDLTGSPDPATWRYMLRYIGPSLLDPAPLAAADVQGRSRAFRALVGNATGKPGIEVSEARRLTGLV